jgi:hypothetical protein
MRPGQADVMYTYSLCGRDGTENRSDGKVERWEDDGEIESREDDERD